jgi:N-acetylglutamate synthase-like GNAT family acetyltransferase
LSVRIADLEKDISNIQRLLKNIDLSHYPQSKEIQNPYHQWLVYEQNETILGCVVAKKDQGEIGHISVDPKFRKSGVGTKLISMSISCLRKAGHDHIWAQVRIENNPSIELFKKKSL